MDENNFNEKQSMGVMTIYGKFYFESYIYLFF